MNVSDLWTLMDCGLLAEEEAGGNGSFDPGSAMQGPLALKPLTLFCHLCPSPWWDLACQKDLDIY